MKSSKKSRNPFLFQNEFKHELIKIPKKNREKFLNHIIKEIELAQQDNYA